MKLLSRFLLIFFISYMFSGCKATKPKIKPSSQSSDPLSEEGEKVGLANLKESDALKGLEGYWSTKCLTYPINEQEVVYLKKYFVFLPSSSIIYFTIHEDNQCENIMSEEALIGSLEGVFEVESSQYLLKIKKDSLKIYIGTQGGANFQKRKHRLNQDLKVGGTYSITFDEKEPYYGIYIEKSSSGELREKLRHATLTYSKI
jgi:hypothetical protein